MIKSLRAAALALTASLAWTADLADAQTGTHPARRAIVPLPPVAPLTSQLIPTGYTYRSYDAPAEPRLAEPTPQPHAPEKFGSAFTTRTHAHDDPSTEAAEHGDPPPPGAAASASPWTDFEQKLRDTGWSDCDTCGTGDGYATDGYASGDYEFVSAGGSGFFGSVGGLVMTRGRANAFITTQRNGDPSSALMNTQNAGAGWTGGGEVTLGYAFGGANQVGPYGASGACGNPGIAFTWWGTGEMNGFASVTDTTGAQATALNTSFDVSGVTIGGDPASDYFVGAAAQRLQRTDIVNSFEANLLQGAMVDTGRLQIIGLAGFRYFRFTEVLTLGSVEFGSTFGANGGADEAYLSYRSFNNLYGGQLGAVLNYTISPRCSLYFTPKAGVFGNQMVVRRRLFLGDGTSNPTISAYKSDVSFLGQLDTGLNFMVRPNVYVYGGYRIVGVSNVALGDNQFGPPLSDVTSATQVKQSGSLILHGVTFGLSYLY